MDCLSPWSCLTVGPETEAKLTHLSEGGQRFKAALFSDGLAICGRQPKLLPHAAHDGFVCTGGRLPLSAYVSALSEKFNTSAPRLTFVFVFLVQ